MYTHVIKKSGIKCYSTVWFPTQCLKAQSRERSHPMMTLETGQITRVSRDNLRKIKISNNIVVETKHLLTS